MKSWGNLFDQIIEPQNLESAMRRAAKGKKNRNPVNRFLDHHDTQLEALLQELVSGNYRPRPYLQFRIADPKPRIISCADFRDRIVHHALCHVIAPLIERRFIFDSFACRKGKGSHSAILRCQSFSTTSPYFLKLDIHRFYDSVDHGILLDLLYRLFRESRLRNLLRVILKHPVPGQSEGKGLPIGNLTSQWFANLYLDRMDHFVKEDLHIKDYIRYMDDMVLFGKNKNDLWMAYSEMKRFTDRFLSLSFNEDRAVLAPVTEGIPFLGFRIFPHFLRRKPSRLRRARRLLKRREKECLLGIISPEQLIESVRAMNGSRIFFHTGEPIVSSLEI